VLITYRTDTSILLFAAGEVSQKEKKKHFFKTKYPQTHKLVMQDPVIFALKIYANTFTNYVYRFTGSKNSVLLGCYQMYIKMLHELIVNISVM